MFSDYDPECENCGHPFSFHYDEKTDGYACDYCDNKRVQCDCDAFADYPF